MIYLLYIFIYNKQMILNKYFVHPILHSSLKTNNLIMKISSQFSSSVKCQQ